MRVALDMEAVYQREGDQPVVQLRQALEAAEGAAGQDPQLEGLRAALTGVVWTRSMRRMFTLVDRWVARILDYLFWFENALLSGIQSSWALVPVRKVCKTVIPLNLLVVTLNIALFPTPCRCLRNQEPVLLIGETGTGKTTVCQLLALMRQQHLHSINCNQHTETSDFLGGYRPCRNRERSLALFQAAAVALAASPLFTTYRIPVPVVPDAIAAPDVTPVLSLFKQAAAQALKAAASEASAAEGVAAVQQQLAELEHLAISARAPFAWLDGPLVAAMRQGDMILVDEINLAEDAVLERLNSVLEPGRTLTLAEKGGEGAEVIKAADGFRCVSTAVPMQCAADCLHPCFVCGFVHLLDTLCWYNYDAAHNSMIPSFPTAVPNKCCYLVLQVGGNHEPWRRFWEERAVSSFEQPIYPNLGPID